MARRQALVAIAQARVRPLGVEVLAPVHDDDLGLSLSRNSAVESRRGIFHRVAGAEREESAGGIGEDRRHTGNRKEPQDRPAGIFKRALRAARPDSLRRTWQHSREHLRYETDLTDAEWGIIEPMPPAPAESGRPPSWPFREIVKAFGCTP